MHHQLKNSEFHLKPGQIQRIIERAGNLRDACIIKMFAQTGIRRAELAALEIPDIDFRQQLIHIRNGKGGKARIVPVVKDLLLDLHKLFSRRRSGAVFLSKRVGHLTLRQVNWIVAQAGERARVRNPNPKYKGLNTHLFRHTFARIWKIRRGSIETLSKILGHSSVKTTLDVYGTEGLSDIQKNYGKTMGKYWDRA